MSAADAVHAGARTRLSWWPSDRIARAASSGPGERGDCAALPVFWPERRRGQRDGETVDLRRRHQTPRPGRTRRAGGSEDDDQHDGPADGPGRREPALATVFASFAARAVRKTVAWPGRCATIRTRWTRVCGGRAIDRSARRRRAPGDTAGGRGSQACQRLAIHHFRQLA